MTPPGRRRRRRRPASITGRHPEAPRFLQRGEGSGACLFVRPSLCRAPRKNANHVLRGRRVLARSLTRLKCAEFRDDASGEETATPKTRLHHWELVPFPKVERESVRAELCPSQRLREDMRFAKNLPRRHWRRDGGSERRFHGISCLAGEILARRCCAGPDFGCHSRFLLGELLLIEIPNNARHVGTSLVERWHPAILLHSLRPGVVGRQRLDEIKVVTFQQH